MPSSRQHNGKGRPLAPGQGRRAGLWKSQTFLEARMRGCRASRKVQTIVPTTLLLPTFLEARVCGYPYRETTVICIVTHGQVRSQASRKVRKFSGWMLPLENDTTERLLCHYSTTYDSPLDSPGRTACDRGQMVVVQAMAGITVSGTSVEVARLLFAAITRQRPASSPRAGEKGRPMEVSNLPGSSLTLLKKGRMPLSGGGIQPKYAVSGDAIPRIARFWGL